MGANKHTFILLAVAQFIAAPVSANDFRLFKECLNINETFYHQIIDGDILEIGNSKNWALVIVNCPGQTFAMSRCTTCPEYQNSAIVIRKDAGKICSGDTIYIDKKPCTIGDIKKERWDGK